MKRYACLAMLAASCAWAPAQPVSPDALRIAELLAGANWQSLERSIPLLTAGMEAKLKASGLGDQLSKVFAQEVEHSMTRENVTRAIARGLSDSFSGDELKQLDGFWTSPLGQRYIAFQQQLMANPKFMSPILKQACASAGKQLEGADRDTLNAICAKF